MPRIFTLLAGLPKDILGPFIARLKKRDGNLNIVQTLPMSSSCYTPEYAEELYRLVGSELRQIVGAERGDWWDINFVVLYVRKQDGGEHHVLKRFDMEALLVPLAMETARRKAPNRHYINIVINSLVSQSTLMLRNARAVLRFLAQEVTNRDTRTCVLLPEANFGAEFDSVKDCVHAAVANPISAKNIRYAVEGCRWSATTRLGRTLSKWAPSVSSSVEGRCPTRLGPYLGYEGTHRPLRDPGTYPFRCAVQPEVSLRLRSRAGQ